MSPYPSDDVVPAYVTSPGNAVAERAHWENTFRSVIAETLLGEAVLLDGPGPDSLVAASFPRWQSIVDRVKDALPPLPRWAENWLRQVDLRLPDDSRSPAKDAADRLAPTLATASYNTHVLQWMAREGFPYKRWVTRHDALVRPSHAATDGQVQPLSQPFQMEGYLLQFPADASTSPIEYWMNCRCVVVAVPGR